MTTPAGVVVQVEAGPTLTLLRRLGAALQDLSPVLGGPVNASVNDLFTRQFATEGREGGTRWAPLAPVTVLLRKRRGHGRGGILRDTNRLWASFTKLGLGPDGVKVVTPDSLQRGSTVPYAAPHQTGFTSRTFVVVNKLGNPVPLHRRSPKKIPARPIVPDPVPVKYISAWERLIIQFVEGHGAA